MEEKMLNPIYTWLAESITIEQAIAKEKNDTRSFATSLLCFFLYSSKQLAEAVEYLAKYFTENGYKPKDLESAAICLFLEHTGKVKLDKKFASQVRQQLKSLKDLNIPLAVKLSIYHITRDIIDLPDLKQLLLDKRLEFQQQNNLENLIEVEYALGKEYYSEKIWIEHENGSLSFEISKIAKLALLLWEKEEKDKLNKCLKFIEKKTREKISAGSLPLISLLIFEAEKLISTNLPADKLTEILENLKHKSKSWATLISDIQDNGIVLDLKRLSSIQNMNIEDSVFAILALEKSGRKETFQMTQVEKNALAEYFKLVNGNNIPIPSSAVRNYIFFLLGWTAIAVCYYLFIGIHQIQSIIINLPTLSYVRIVPEQMGDLISFPIVTLIFLKYYFYSWNYLKRVKKFNGSGFVKSLIAIKPIN